MTRCLSPGSWDHQHVATLAPSLPPGTPSSLWIVGNPNQCVDQAFRFSFSLLLTQLPSFTGNCSLFPVETRVCASAWELPAGLLSSARVLWQVFVLVKIIGIFWPQTLFFCFSHSQSPVNRSHTFTLVQVLRPPLTSSPSSSALMYELG